MNPMCPTERMLVNYVSKQLEGIVPDGYCWGDLLLHSTPVALRRTNACVSRILVSSGKDFDYLVSWQYATFLYFLSRTLFLDFQEQSAAVRVFLLNKAVNGLDLYYEIDLGTCFFLSHTSAIVFAKATYGKYCVFHQGCTVGRQGVSRPVLEEGVVMFPGSQIIGRSNVLENTVLSAGVSLVNCSTPGNCLVFNGKSGRPVFKELNEFYADRYFLRQKADTE